MKNRPVYLLLVILGALAIVVSYRYEQYVALRNFVLDVQAPCDPATHSCFVSDCSPADDPACDTTPYDKVEIIDGEAPTCLEEHTCDEFSCAGYANCSISYCSDETLEDGEACSPASGDSVPAPQSADATTTP